MRTDPRSWDAATSRNVATIRDFMYIIVTLNYINYTYMYIMSYRALFVQIYLFLLLLQIHLTLFKVYKFKLK